MDTLEKFRLFEGRNATHLNRFLKILERQVDNQRQYVELFRRYPANSVEFKVEVERLYSELCPLLEDFQENNNNIISDGELFVEVLNELRKDINKLPKDWGKKKKKRKHD